MGVLDKTLQGLLQVSSALASDARPHDVLNMIVEQICKISNAEWVGLVLISEKGETQALATRGINEQFELRDMVRRDGHSHWIMTHNKSVIVSNIQTYDPAQYGNIEINPRTIEQGIKAIIGLSLSITHGEYHSCIGVMWLHFKEIQTFTPEEIKTLEIYSNHAAVIIDTSQKLNQLNTAKIVARIATLDDANAGLKVIANEIKNRLPCDLVGIVPVDHVSKVNIATPIMTDDLIDKHKTYLPDTIIPKSLIYTLLNSDGEFFEAYKDGFYIAARDRFYISEDVPNDKLFALSPFVKREKIKASIAIQLHAKGYKVGVMFINYRTDHTFLLSEINDIQLYANQVALAVFTVQIIEKEQLALAHEQRRREILEALHQAEQVMRSTTNIYEILKVMAKAALDIIGNKCQSVGCFSHIMLKEGNKLRFAAANDDEMLKKLRSSRKFLDISQKSPIGITGRAAKLGEVQRVGDVSTDKDYIKIQSNIRSQLAVPIKSDHAVIGVISIEYPELNAFSEEDQKNITLLTELAVAAIDKERNLARSQELQSRTMRMTSLLDTLPSSKLSISQQPLSRFWVGLRKSFAEICLLFRADGYVFRNIGREGNAMTYTFNLYTSSPPSMPNHKIQIEVKDEIWSRLQATLGAYALTLGDLHKYIPTTKAVIEIDDLSIETVVITFDAADTKCIIIFVNNPANSINSSDLNTLNFKDQAELFKSLVMDLQDKYTTAFFRLLALSQQQALEQFVLDIAHQLKTPLSGIRNLCQALVHVDMTWDLRQKRLRNIYEQAKMIYLYATNFEYAAKSKVTQLGTKSLRLQDYKSEDLVQLLIDWAKNFQVQADYRNLKGPNVDVGSFSEFPMLKLDSKLFEILILNLYDNAVKYSHNGKLITVSGKVVENTVELYITNYGVPIYEAETDLIFTRYKRTLEAIHYTNEGTGIGLYLCKLITELHGGKISVAPSTPVGDAGKAHKVTFVVSLPTL